METVGIETTQNVAIDYPIAGLGERILAAFLDYLILFGYVIGMSILFSKTKLLDSVHYGWAITTIILLPYMLYDLTCELFMDGQSFGKKILRIKVVKLDGSQPGFGDYLLRWLLRIVDITVLFGAVAMITIIINGRGQRLGDLAAGTTVVKIRPTARLEDTILAEVPQDYIPVFPQVSLLTDSDIAIVKKVLDTEVETIKMANHMNYKTKVALENKMGIKSDMAPLEFLETLVKDYNAQVKR